MVEVVERLGDVTRGGVRGGEDLVDEMACRAAAECVCGDECGQDSVPFVVGDDVLAADAPGGNVDRFDDLTMGDWRVHEVADSEAAAAGRQRPGIDAVAGFVEAGDERLRAALYAVGRPDLEVDVGGARAPRVT